jgi:ABC-2 type transport system ATP-binding protein
MGKTGIVPTEDSSAAGVSPGGAALIAAGINAGYRARPVLRDVSVSFGPGLHLILGPNGAGKTTLFRVLAGILRPTAGQVCILGRDPFADVAVKAQVGVAAHRAALASRLSVAGNLHYWARVLGLTTAERPARVHAVLELLDLDTIADRRAGSLSRGQAQRVSLARAMLNDPPVLLLDEPFAGVDPQVTVQLRGHLRTLARAGRTLLVSTHELAEANEIGDDVTVLRDGAVVGQGNAAQLRSSLVGTGYRLRIKGSGDLAGALVRAGYRPEPSVGSFIVQVADEQAAQKLVAELVTSGIGITEAAPAANPLEDLYLRLQEGSR